MKNKGSLDAHHATLGNRYGHAENLVGFDYISKKKKRGVRIGQTHKFVAICFEKLQKLKRSCGSIANHDQDRLVELTKDMTLCLPSSVHTG